MADGDKKKQRWKGKIWADEHRGVAEEVSHEGNRDGEVKQINSWIWKKSGCLLDVFDALHAALTVSKAVALYMMPLDIKMKLLWHQIITSHDKVSPDSFTTTLKYTFFWISRESFPQAHEDFFFKY